MTAVGHCAVAETYSVTQSSADLPSSSSRGHQSTVLAGCDPSWRLKRRIHSSPFLSFSGDGWHPLPPKNQVTLKPLDVISPSLAPTHLPLSYKDPCDCHGPFGIIQNNGLISGFFTNHGCRVPFTTRRSCIHRFWRKGGGRL